MTEQEILELATQVIDANDIALVGTISLKRYPNIKALKKMKNEGLKTFYFSTKINSAKVKQIKRRSKGSVYFYDRENYKGVMLEGHFKVENNTTVGISDLYELDAIDPYDFCTLKFVAEYIYVYTHYQTVKIKL
jgi:general stress protein 26